MKTCTKCRVEKSLSEFYVHKQSRDGTHNACKTCLNAVNAKWVSSNPSKRKAHNATYRVANATKIKASNAVYSAVNKSAANVRSAVWRKDNPGQCRIQQHNRRARKINNCGKLSTNLIEKLFTLQKGTCPCCRLPLMKDYHLDHIMPLALGGGNNDNNMQLLRSTCNQQKHAKHPIDFMQQRGFLL